MRLYTACCQSHLRFVNQRTKESIRDDGSLYQAFAEYTIPGLRVVGANVGHAVTREAVETFNTAIIGFLR
jgi:hypothetical protein